MDDFDILARLLAIFDRLDWMGSDHALDALCSLQEALPDGALEGMSAERADAVLWAFERKMDATGRPTLATGRRCRRHPREDRGPREGRPRACR